MRVAGIVLLLCAVPAFAQEGFGGSVTVTSDYIYRGVSQSRGNPALQADVHYAAPQGWSVGLWGSTVELNWWEGRTAEIDAYIGYRVPITRDFSARVSAVHYEYPWNNGPLPYDYNEVVGSIAYKNNLFFTVAWSLDSARYSTPGYAVRNEALSYELAGAIPLVDTFTVNVGIGYFDLSQFFGTGYAYWNAGVSYDWRTFRADVTYYGSESKNQRWYYGNVAGDRLAAGLSWRF